MITVNLGRMKRQLNNFCSLTALIVFFIVAINRFVEPVVFSLCIYVPSEGPRRMGFEAYTAVELAMNRINNDPEFTAIRERNHTFNYRMVNSACEPGSGLYQFVEMTKDLEGINAVIGPYCDDVCTSVGLLAGRYKIPFITYGCESDELLDRELYPTFMRTTGTFKDMSNFIRMIVQHFGWTRITLVSGRQDVWLEAVSSFEEFFEDINITIRKWVMRRNVSYDFNERLTLESKRTRVFILCAYGDDIIKFMYAVHQLNLNNGDYAFLAVDYLDMARKLNLNDTVLQSNMFDGLLDITVDVKPNLPAYQNFLKDVKAKDDGSHGYQTSYEHSIHAALLADAIIVYAFALNATIANNSSPHDGISVANHLFGTTVPGISGDIKILQDGSRDMNFLLHNIRNNTYTMIARSHNGEFIVFPDKSVYWPGGSARVPLGRPTCDWDGSLCDDYGQQIGMGVGIPVFVLFVIVCVAIVYWQKARAENYRLNRMDWKISFNRLQLREKKDRNSEHSFKSVSQASSLNSGGSSDANISLGGQVFTQVAVLDRQAVAIKPILKSSIAVTMDMVREINSIRSLRYKTINQLIGACVEPNKVCLIWAYCGKGSLHDVLQNRIVKLDWIFKVSFMSDIVRGMSYLHESEIQVHGRLKSTNILVDNHWCCKVGDLAMPLFRAGERTVHTDFNKLWVAPEVLRDPITYARGSKQADVYAFGIILQELFLRMGPYGNVSLEPREIVERIINCEVPPFRPVVEKGVVADNVLDVMKSCWEENQELRPTFRHIGDQMRRINRGKTTNIIDQMIHMLSKYADHLEDLVADRTKQLEEEQQKTDELLCRMLPATIANELKRGNQVSPAYFDSATVFFSDVVGFTKLASDSTPFEIVNFLNHLYTTFDNIIDKYDVYKVETIGDAYMVASGLPIPNGKRHAGEIATMALDLLASTSIFTIAHRPNQLLQLRTGMHTGPVCAGVVGLKMPRYCLFGDTVNYSSRMETSGLALRIHVSKECKAVLDQLGGYRISDRGLVDMKGKGSMYTYWLTGKDGFDRELPSLELQAPLSEHFFK